MEMPWDGRIPASSSLETPFFRIGGGIVYRYVHVGISNMVPHRLSLEVPASPTSSKQAVAKRGSSGLGRSSAEAPPSQAHRLFIHTIVL